MKHTKEPWKYLEVIGGCWVIAGERHVLEYLCFPDEENRANAERIVACVNACAGIENEKLGIAGGIVQIILDKHDEILQLRSNADKLARELEWYATIHRCENPIRQPLPNPQGYASNVECLPCGVCHHCTARAALVAYYEASK